MQNKEFDPVFMKSPNDVNVLDAKQIFESPPADTEVK